jgi:D-sedoheptulose 7-phosphate isomerase
MNRLDQIFGEAENAEAFARLYLDYLAEVFARIDEVDIAAFVELLLAARERGARIFFVGNGGSAATASHFANDLAIGTRAPGKPFRAVSLTDNLAIVTAIANDDGYDEVFVQQLRAQMQANDVVVAISASGNSPNVVKAVEYANENGGRSVALTGFDGGRLARIAALNVHIPTDKGEYGPAEDGHMVLDHLIGAYLMRRVREGGA